LPGQKAAKNAKAKMSDVGNQLLLEGKAAVKAAGGDKDISSHRDLLSLLLKANMAEDGPGKSRLSDEEVIARTSLFHIHSANTQRGSEIPAFFVAGHETTRCVCLFGVKAQLFAAYIAPVPPLRGHCTPSPRTNPPKASFGRN
jgi:cytochrome P450